VLLFAVGIAFTVLSEDLGELAKKEKARREAIDKAGKKAKVFTNEDIGRLKSQTAIESTPAEGTAAAPSQDTSDTSYYTPPVEGQEYVSPEEPVQQADPAAERKKQLQELEDKREELEQQAKEARDNVGAGGLWHSRNTGDQYRTAREAEANATKVEKQIDDLESKRNQQAQPPAPQEPAYQEYVPPGEETPAEEPAASEDTSTEEPPF
jgi:hypothetical protein